MNRRGLFKIERRKQMIDLKIKAQRPAIIKGYENEIYALVKASASDNAQHSESLPLNLSIVIDRSGSMAGLPLEEAKKSAAYIVSKMRDIDRLAIVTYDHNARVILPSQRVLNKAAINEVIFSITGGGSTDLHQGWLAGAEEVARNKSSNSLNRVLLLSDGNANSGETSAEVISSQCGQLADEGIITSTYGLGHHFNEQLMISMARTGLGQSYYGETADDLLDPFQEEFDLLINTFAWNLKLKAEAPNFVDFELLNKFKVAENDHARWHLPNLAEGGEAWALFKLKVNDLNENAKTIEVLRCNLSYETKVNDEVKIHNEGPIKLVLDRLSPSAFNAIAEDEEVKRRLDELTIANLQERAREASLRGDWVRVEQIIVEGRRVAGTNEWLQNNLAELAVFAKRRQRDQFSKEAIYSADKMNRRLSSSSEMHSMDYDMSAEIDKKAYLRRKVSRGKRMPRL